MIHPTAIIDSGAVIGKGVTIGPYSVIADNVVIGDDCVIGPHVVISHYTTLGKGNRIFQFASVGEDPQYLKYRGEPTELVIGDRNTIRENVTINRGTADNEGVTTIGNDNLIMACAHIAHDCTVHNHTVFANGSSLAGHVVVEDFALLGGYTMVHQFVNIGAHCITGIGSQIYKDVPPYIIASGAPAVPHGLNKRGLQRRDFTEDTVKAIKQAYKILYRSGLRFSQAIEAIEESSAYETDEVVQFVHFLKNTDRGIIRA